MFGQCVVDLIGVLLVLMRYPEDVEQLNNDAVSLEMCLTIWIRRIVLMALNFVDLLVPQCLPRVIVICVAWE